MADSVQFAIGAEALASDGPCGKLQRVIVEPVADVVTHLVIGPAHAPEPGRLVPVDLVDNARSDEVRLGCTTAEFEQLDPAEKDQFIPGDSGYKDYDTGEVAYLPHYGLGMGTGMGTGMGMSGGNAPHTVTYDSVPPGEVEIRRGDNVATTDGEIGRVQGLVIDPASHHVTHVLLQEGHLWGRKEVAIPISAVASTSEGILLNISKQEVRDLPPVDVSYGPAGKP